MKKAKMFLPALAALLIAGSAFAAAADSRATNAQQSGQNSGFWRNEWDRSGLDETWENTRDFFANFGTNVRNFFSNQRTKYQERRAASGSGTDTVNR